MLQPLLPLGKFLKKKKHKRKVIINNEKRLSFTRIFYFPKAVSISDHVRIGSYYGAIGILDQARIGS